MDASIFSVVPPTKLLDSPNQEVAYRAGGPTDLSLAGRVALVTGGSRGIGRGIALELAGAGAAVAVTYRRDAVAAADCVDSIHSAGGRAIAVRASMSEPTDIDALAEAVLAEFGFVDILVSSAGDGGRGIAIADTYPAELRRLMMIYAFSPARLAQLLLPQMRARRRGDIVLISSSEVIKDRPRDGGFKMAIAALDALGAALAEEEVANGVRVNTVAPGLVASESAARRARTELGVDDLGALEAGHPLGDCPGPQTWPGSSVFWSPRTRVSSPANA